jgi:hypothetical protein
VEVACRGFLCGSTGSSCYTNALSVIGAKVEQFAHMFGIPNFAHPVAQNRIQIDPGMLD